MLRRLALVVMVVGGVLVFGKSTAAGQGFHGGVRGAVQDAGGAVPGAAVSLTNEATSVSRTALSNSLGEYAFASVEPGTYTIKIALQGYKTVERPGIRVDTQSFLVLDHKLEVGALEESVTVSVQTPVVETANASHGGVLDRVALETLPSSGRAAFLMAASMPTVIPSGDGQFNRQQDQSGASSLSLGGGTRRGNNYVLDGVSITDIVNRAVANPTIEALEDVKVQVHTYDAEMGRTGGGVFNSTLKSGTNTLRGTGFFQTRPLWGQTNNYFSELAGRAKPESVYYLGGGGIGGPIVRNRTFFWFASENYHDIQSRSVSTAFPTAAERTGDFSRLTNASGAPVVIYDPLTRQPFPGNIIPANRINPVAAAIAGYLPLPDVDADNGTNNYTRTAEINNRYQQEYTIKVEHKFSDAVSLSGFYLYNRTDEPDANYFEVGLNGGTRFADPNDYLLKRRPQILALNNNWVVGNNSVLSLRYGWTRFPDNATMTIPFDPAALGFSPSFLRLVDQTGVPKFPNGSIAGYSGFGAITPSYRTYSSWSTNATFSRLFGRHTLKVGGDFREIGVDLLSPGDSAGRFQFDKEFTSSTGLNNSSTTEGNGFASFLLGYPSANASRQSTMTLTTPLEIKARYYGGYVQDDWRVSSRLTLNYGLRIEHEDGMREASNNFTVGFDPAATNALSSVTIPADAVAGTPARAIAGGVMFAGIDGHGIEQGNLPGVLWSPRVGAVYAITPSLVLRGGYGIYWAPWNYPAPSSSSNNYGQLGFTNNTVVPQTAGTPTVSLSNPFPNGLVAPLGSSLGTLTGVGTSISYVDQHRTIPRVQQYSADLQKELPGQMAVTVSYIGARGDHLPLGGTNDVALNINQLDPKYMALGSRLNDALPNPFFGNPAAGPLASQATLTRAQLLRPYPQFLNISARQVSEGINRYNAGVVEWTRRTGGRHWFGGRVSYTYSVLKDNQFGESNFFSSAGAALPLNAYNYIEGSSYYNPRAEYGYGILDVPHRIVMSPIVEIPFGDGRRWSSPNRVVDLLAGGWTAAAIVTIQSGFPIGLGQSDNTGTFGGGQRPNLVDGADASTAGSFEERLASADHPAATWLNPAAFTTALPFTFGNAPRTITDVRTPPQRNVDLSVAKNIRLGGTRFAQVRVEVINLLNRVTTAGISTTAGSSAFGQISSQSGFMRLTQFSFRYSF
jgi:hypothetical protein